MEFDVIVVGSGMSGGWVAKELSENGLKTLVIERGSHVEHGADYQDFTELWDVENRSRMPEDELDEHYSVQRNCYAFNTTNKQLFVKDSDHPYETPEGQQFNWFRGYHLGGRSLLWARHSYRLSDLDFEANAKDGHGIDWPIRYADLAPWYDHVEQFAGISGSTEGLAHLPDGQFLPAMELNCLEKEFKASIEQNFPGRTLIMGRVAHLTEPKEQHTEIGRGACQYRDMCYRGCSFGAYFSSLSATLPAAQRTGNLTVVTDAICESVTVDPETGRATGVRVIDAKTKEGSTYEARAVFLCASALGTAQIMLNSVSDAFPEGIANSSGLVGRNLMDHVSGLRARGRYPGLTDRYYSGKRPAGFYIPRFRNVQEQESEFVRGYGVQGSAVRANWRRGAATPGVGASLKEELRAPGDWGLSLHAFGEMLPRSDNRVSLHPTRKDKWGIPVPVIDCTLGENDLKLAAQAAADVREMLEVLGCVDITTQTTPYPPGHAIHEMGTACMGRDPATSVLNGFNQSHDVPNLFVTDGACMTSSACQNPSLTYMAISARAANHAAELFREGVL